MEMLKKKDSEINEAIKKYNPQKLEELQKYYNKDHLEEIKKAKECQNKYKPRRELISKQMEHEMKMNIRQRRTSQQVHQYKRQTKRNRYAIETKYFNLLQQLDDEIQQCFQRELNAQREMNESPFTYIIELMLQVSKDEFNQLQNEALQK